MLATPVDRTISLVLDGAIGIARFIGVARRTDTGGVCSTSVAPAGLAHMVVLPLRPWRWIGPRAGAGATM